MRVLVFAVLLHLALGGHGLESFAAVVVAAIDPGFNERRQLTAYLDHCTRHGHVLSYVVRSLDGVRNAVNLIRTGQAQILVTAMPAFFTGEPARVEPDIAAAGGRVEYVSDVRADPVDVYMVARLRRRGRMTPPRIAYLTELPVPVVRGILDWL